MIIFHIAKILPKKSSRASTAGEEKTFLCTIMTHNEPITMQIVLFDLHRLKGTKPKICCKGTTFYPNLQKIR